MSNKPFKRSCVLVSDEFCQIAIGELVVYVPYHAFWEKFSAGWEPDTERAFKANIKPASTVLDIGAWIGPTVLLALACGAGKIVALEPNPNSYASLEKMMGMNPEISDKVVLLNKAIGSNTETVTMGLVSGEDDTSTSSIAGNDFTVQTITLESLRESCQLDHIDLVKIDIEGAESLLAEDLKSMSQREQIIHLSIHVPLFPPEADKNALANALDYYTIHDDRGKRLNGETLRNRLTTDKKYPEWGTQHGNYFELLMVGKKSVA